MRTLRRSYIVMFAMSLAALLVLGPAGTAAHAAKRTVRVLYPAGLDMEKGAFLAGWDLYLKDIKVEPVILRGQTTVARAIMSGKEHLAYQTFSVFAQTVAKGGKMTALAVSEQRIAWALVAANSIKSVKDLKGRKVAAHAPAGLSASIVDYYAAKSGFKRNDFQMLYIRGGENRVAAMLAGKVDASPVALIDAEEALKSGRFHVLSVFAEEAPDVVGPLLVGSPKFIKENPDLVQKLVTAAIKGIRLAYRDPKRFAKAVKAHAPYNNDALFQKGYQDFVKYQLWPKNGGAPLRATLQKSVDWYVKNSPAAAKKMGLAGGFKLTDEQVDASFLQNALKELGRK